MKRIVKFSSAFLPAIILSTLVVVSGIVAFVLNGGFNLGVDFQAGLMQEVQFVPRAISLSYSGRGTAQLALASNRLDIIISGTDIDKATHSFPFNAYPRLEDMADALEALEGLSIGDVEDGDVQSSWLVQSASQNPRLGQSPTALYYLDPEVDVLSIEEVRAALDGIDGVAVQNLGQSNERKFMIRVIDDGSTEGFAQKASESLSLALDKAFGEHSWAVSQSNYVGSRFSKNLTDQVFLLVALTLVLITIYAAIRFKINYALGAVIAIVHDVLIMIAFIAFFKIEFSTLTIAAFLTILGYSINDTIVIFDRIRENKRLYPEEDSKFNFNRSLTETLGRTIITSATTLLAVISLYIFTSGSMKDFAYLLIVGLIAGSYSSIFISSSFVLFTENLSEKKRNKTKKVPKEKVAKA